MAKQATTMTSSTDGKIPMDNVEDDTGLLVPDKLLSDISKLKQCYTSILMEINPYKKTKSASTTLTLTRNN